MKKIGMRTSISVFVSLMLVGALPVQAAELSVAVAGTRLNVEAQSILEQRWQLVARQGLDISCGSAALATILQYHYQDDVTEEGLLNGLFYLIGEKKFRKQGGFSLLDLKRVSQEIGYEVKGYKLSLEDLGEMDMPAIVPLTIRKYKHFVVFRKLIGDRVLLADPAFGNIVLSAVEFDYIWQGVALVVTKDPSGKTPLPTRGIPETLVMAPTATRQAIVEPRRLFRALRFNEF